MGMLDNYGKALEQKYSQKTESEIRDTHLLMDILFLNSFNILNAKTVGDLAFLANVHPDYVTKIAGEFEAENHKLMAEKEAEEIKKNTAEISDVLPEISKTEALRLVTDVVKDMEKKE